MVTEGAAVARIAAVRRVAAQAVAAHTAADLVAVCREAADGRGGRTVAGSAVEVVAADASVHRTATAAASRNVSGTSAPTSLLSSMAPSDIR